MIHINTNNSPDILRLWADENWENGIGDFETFEKELLKLKMLNKKCILVWSNPNHTEDDEGGFPPMTSFFQIVKSLFFLRDLIRQAISFNIIHLQDKRAKENVEKVLEWYTPVNETRLVNTKEEIIALINERSSALSESRRSGLPAMTGL